MNDKNYDKKNIHAFLKLQELLLLLYYILKYYFNIINV